MWPECFVLFSMNRIANGWLAEFPSSAFQLQSIQEIYIDVAGSFFPRVNDTTNAWNSTSLAILYAFPSNSSRSNIPDSSCFMRRSISAGAITVDIPSSINNLTNLQSLKLSTGFFEELPANLSGLVSLRNLDVRTVYSNNGSRAFAPFATIPNVTSLFATLVGPQNSWIWTLKSLTSFDYFEPGTFLDLVPAIGDLVNLEYLSLWAIFRNEFHSSMANLTRLRTLRLINGNRFTGPTTLPSFFANMSALENINIQAFTISGSFPALGLFPNLTAFYLGSISGMTTPPSMIGANKLQTITISGCSSLTSFPDIPDGGLPNLQGVTLSNLPGVSQDLPIGFYNSAKMSSVSWSNTGVSGPLSPRITQWTELKYLQLGSLGLSGPIPANMSQLAMLVSLFVTSLPNLGGPLVANLPRLSSLSISGTAISEINITGTSTLNQMCAIFLFLLRCRRFPNLIHFSAELCPTTLFFPASQAGSHK
jgi:hypothetical protein